MNPPAFQFYPADWLSDEKCCLYSLEEEGAYIRLLCYCWREGSIPSDPEKCARLIGKGCSTTLSRVVQGAFLKDPSNEDRMIHPRLMQERQKQDEWRSKCAAGGRKSQQLKLFLKDKGSCNGSYKGSSTLQSSSSSSDISTLASEVYQLYPRKVGRPKAIQAILKASKKVGFDVLKEKTKAYAISVNGSDPQFIPHPTTWFNQERFNDNPSTWNNSNGGRSPSDNPRNAGTCPGVTDYVAAAKRLATPVARQVALPSMPPEPPPPAT